MLADICRGCGEAAVRPFFDLGSLPLAGGFLRGPEEIAGERRYPLLISVCDNCSLIQIVDPVDPEVLFGDYAFATGTVAGLVRHFDGYAEWIKERFGPQTVIEFGANDGTLVAALQERGIRALGVDLAPNITEMAREQGREVLTGAFGPEMLAELRERIPQADLVTGSNVFAHNAQPATILQAADAILAPDGVLCLEVMYAGDLLEQLQWDTLYHEHLTFYSLETLGRLLRRFGFEPIDAERIPMHGGSLRLSAARAGRHPPGSGVDTVAAWERAVALNDPATWDRFAADCRRRIDAFGQTMRRLSESSEIWAYGAAGQGHHVGEHVRDDLSRGGGRRLSPTRRPAHAGHPYPDRQPAGVQAGRSRLCVRLGLELSAGHPGQRASVRRLLDRAAARDAGVLVVALRTRGCRACATAPASA